MLLVKNVSLKYDEKEILSDINLQLLSGEFVILLGSNGSGKSSLLKLIDRRYGLQEGKIFVADHSIESLSTSQLARIVVTLSQNATDSLFPHLTVEENCLLAMNRSKLKNIPKSYLKEFNPHLELHKKTLAGQLSGGEQQALALALACLAQSHILLLDEHTSALDPHTAERLMKITAKKIEEQKITCLLTTHNLEIALQYGSRIIALKNGKIAHDFSREEKALLSLTDLKEKCYDSI
jgi:putative ABC transport system ATP-binding protein